jgi:hypothetical protein
LEYPEIPDELLVQITEELRQKYQEVDPLALDSEENWWSVILEQVEQGLL